MCFVTRNLKRRPSLPAVIYKRLSIASYNYGPIHKQSVLKTCVLVKNMSLNYVVKFSPFSGRILEHGHSNYYKMHCL